MDVEILQSMNGSTEKPGFPPPCARSRGSWRPFLIAGLLGLSASLVEAATRQPFLEQHCYDCHDAETNAAIWNYFVTDDGGGKFYGRLPVTTARETGSSTS